jgi:uncharacterized protein (TIGR02391 family)
MRGKTMKLRRVDRDGQVHEADVEAMDLGPDHGITFRVDADVEDGDEVTDTLPNGRTKTMRLRDVHVLQPPGGRVSQLDHTGAKYTVVTMGAALTQPTPVALPGMHPLISATAGTKIASKHYDNAVFDAFKAVEERVQALSGDTRSGAKLMGGVFDVQSPLLDITSDKAGDAQKADEREGFKFLFMGAAIKLRNTRGHGADLKTDEQEAMFMLAFASLLMGRLDRAEKRQPPNPVKYVPPKSPVPPGFGGMA